jgi:hypothetical protein
MESTKYNTLSPSCIFYVVFDNGSKNFNISYGSQSTGKIDIFKANVM